MDEAEFAAMVEQNHARVAAEQDVLRANVEELRGLVRAGDLDMLWAVAADLREQLQWARTHHTDEFSEAVTRIAETVDDLYDEAFPVRDPADPVDVLDAPWSTARRRALLRDLAGGEYWSPLTPVAERALAAGDTRLLQVLLRSPFGTLPRDLAVRTLDALYAAGALDESSIEAAFLADVQLWNGASGFAPDDDTATPAACAGAVRDHISDVLWQLSDPAADVNWSLVPRVPPRGLRFVLRALEWPGDPEIAAFLGSAALTDAERKQLAVYLEGRPAEEHRRVFDWRLLLGDADVLLPLLGAPTAGPLLRLAVASSIERPYAPGPLRTDRAAVLEAAEEAGDDGIRTVLKLCPSEPISAVLGRNRKTLERRLKSIAPGVIAAYGLLPLADGETVLDRYQALRAAANDGRKLGVSRARKLALAMDVALDHLAQVAGMHDGSHVEWDCEARLTADAPTPSQLRDQARRMRTGLIERLVATGGTLEPDALARLRTLPAGAAMLPQLIWYDRTGALGLLDDLDTSGAVTAAHPYLLYDRGVLGDWQAEIVRRRIRQPVKQAFRELYLLTPAERDTGAVSRRFAGHQIDGGKTVRLLAGRGWSIEDNGALYAATRPVAGAFTAALSCSYDHLFAFDPQAVIEGVQFLAGRHPLPLTDVPPVAFSEVMRDLDLVVSVAASGPNRYTSTTHARTRARLLARLVDDLGLDRIRADGSTAVVQGARATYRVHLASGSVHVEPGGQLCELPDSFGRTAHRDLFLPFAGEDTMTSAILSKVLMLAEDEKITDRSILEQLDRLA